MKSQKSNFLLNQTFFRLNKAEKDVLYSHFSTAKIILKLISFLEKNPKKSFRSHEAVEAIYNIKNDHINYSRFENNFLKRRKELQDAMIKLFSSKDSQNIFEEEEVAFHEIKKDYFLKFNFAELLIRLDTLEKKCWQKNIFELLSEIIVLKIKVKQESNVSETIDKDFESLSLVNALVSDLNKINYLSLYLSGDKNAAAKYSFLDQNSKIVSVARKRQGSYIRFRLIYLNLKFQYYLNLRNQNKIKFYARNYIKLLKNNSSIPVYQYEPNYQNQQLIESYLILAHTYYNLLEFEEAFEYGRLHYNEMKKEEEKDDYTNMGFYSQLISFSFAAFRFDYAKKLLEEINLYFKNKNRKWTHFFYVAEKINIQIASTDILLCKDPELLYFKEQINYLETSINLLSPIQNYKTRYYRLFLSFYCLMGDEKNFKKTIKIKLLKPLLSAEINSFFKILLNIMLLIKKKDFFNANISLQKLKNDSENILENIKDQSFKYLQVRWFNRVAERLILINKKHL